MLPEKKEKIVIWGASGHAMVIADIVRLCGCYELVGFLDDYNPARAGEIMCGAHVLGGREQLEGLHAQSVKFIAFGFGNCSAKAGAADIAREKGFELATLIHPSAIIAQETHIGAGAVICAGAVIGPSCNIGESVIINTSASVDHECTVGDCTHICPGVHIAGRVSVGNSSWIGIGTSVADGVTIGERTLIGAGSVVVKNIGSGVVAYGVPARAVRKCEESF
ncbi:acetyltransferase [bacterium]|nr:acetyltransferase [bacterium]